MGERKDLRDLLRDTDFAQKRIIDDLASSSSETMPPERGMAGDIRRSEGGDFIKNIFLGLLLVGIVVGAFLISFFLGFIYFRAPVKNLPSIEIPLPKAVTQSEIEKAVPAPKELAPEPEIKEREITAVEKTARLPKPVSPVKLATPKKIPVKLPLTVKLKTSAKMYKVIVGTFDTAAAANALATELKSKGFQSYSKKVGSAYRVQAGAFDTNSKTVPLVVKLKAAGYNPTIIVE